jgi:aarF domain-containing kinase
LKPFKLKRKKATGASGEALDHKSDFDAQLGMKQRLKSMLVNEQLIPRELIFLGRWVVPSSPNLLMITQMYAHGVRLI